MNKARRVRFADWDGKVRIYMEVSLGEWRAMKRLERAARELRVASYHISNAVDNLDAVRRRCK